MNILLLFIFIPFVSSFEYYCPKGENPKWDEVEKLMNDPETPAKYKFPASLTKEILTQKCTNDDILIVRRMDVKIVNVSKYSPTRFLSVLEGKDIKEFMEKGGICHKKYNEKAGTHVEFSGRGDLSERNVLYSCGYRELSCGDEVYQKEMKIEGQKEYDIWCKLNLQSKQWSTFFTEEPLFKMYDDELICDMESNKSVNHNMLCLKQDCSSVKVGNRWNEVCREDMKMNKRLYSFTRTASTWGREAFKHFFRNYILTLVFYSYFMLQARRRPMIRYELSSTWKKFKSAIDPKDDEENTPVDGAKRREKFVYERCKKEFDRKGQGRVKKVMLEHMTEELKEAKDGISKQAALVKEEEGESASNRPPNISAGTKLLPKEPCSANELRALIQWSWIVESQMVKSMKDDDNPTELCKFYGLDVRGKIEKLK